MAAVIGMMISIAYSLGSRGSHYIPCFLCERPTTLVGAVGGELLLLLVEHRELRLLGDDEGGAPLVDAVHGTADQDHLVEDVDLHVDDPVHVVADVDAVVRQEVLGLHPVDGVVHGGSFL